MRCRICVGFELLKILDQVAIVKFNRGLTLTKKSPCRGFGTTAED